MDWYHKVVGWWNKVPDAILPWDILRMIANYCDEGTKQVFRATCRTMKKFIPHVKIRCICSQYGFNENCQAQYHNDYMDAGPPVFGLMRMSVAPVVRGLFL